MSYVIYIYTYSIYHPFPTFQGIMWLPSVGATLLEIKLRCPNSVATRVSKNTTSITNRCANIPKNEDTHITTHIQYMHNHIIHHYTPYMYVRTCIIVHIVLHHPV